MQKIFFLLSCLIIHVPLLFAASNSKDHGKNSKSKVEAAAPASASAAATPASILKHDIPELTVLSVAEVLKLGFSESDLVRIPLALDYPVPHGYRNFGCKRNALHQHICKKDAETQAYEFPIQPMEYLLRKLDIECERVINAGIVHAFKNNEKITSPLILTVPNPCRYATGSNNSHNEFTLEIDLSAERIPHRPESPIPDEYELANSVDATQECSICDVDDAAHKHFKKK